MDPSGPSPEGVRAELARVLATPAFAYAPRLSNFLRFIVEEALAGRSSQIKEYAIGVAVYRKDSGYDPRLDATVRVEAAKLRSRLERYYEDYAPASRLRISVPKGGYVPRFEPEFHANTREPSATFKSIAVLPFLNLSADPENEYFSDGLADELTSTLTRTGLMRVASRTSAFAFKGRRTGVREIGAALGVERVLEGSVRKFGGRLRIVVQLVDAQSARQLWSQTYQRTIEDLFAIQEEVARAVATRVCGNAGAEKIPRPYTATSEAFELYLKGRHLVDKWHLGSEQKALEFFQQSIAADPDYPIPYVGVATAVICLATMGFAPPVDILPEAKAALARALELAPGLAEAHLARGRLIARHEWDWRAAEEEFRIALDLAPALAQAHNDYATEYLAPLGRFDEALAAARYAREFDPFSPAIADGRGWILLHARRFEECEQEFRSLLSSGAVYEGARPGLAFALMGQRRYDESLTEWRRITALEPSPLIDSITAAVLALKGDREEALCICQRIEELSRSIYVHASALASAYIALGDADRAFELLDRALAFGEASLRSLKVGFDWDPIRSDPRFGRLLAKVGFESRSCFRSGTNT